MKSSAGASQSALQQSAVPEDQVYGQIRTRDIFHAAFLITRGMQVKEILPDRTIARSKVIFVIGGNGISGLEEEYRSGSVVVNVFSFKESVQLVKDVMFDYIRTHGLS